MNRRSAIVAGLLGASLLGGCADLMQRSTIAPEWFQAKAVEVKGEGYPDIRDIPQSRGPTGGAAEWEGEAAALKSQAAKIEADAAKTAAEGETLPTDEELRAKAAQMRALIDGKSDVEGAPAAAPPAPAP